MSLVEKIMGTTSRHAVDSGKSTTKAVDTLTDGAIDTLSSVIRVMGDESFPLEKDIDPSIFPEICREFSSHVANGTAVPSIDIPASPDGVREWASIRQFFSDRRKAEKSFVSERLQNYRGVVEDLVSGLRTIGERDQTTETSILRSLNTIEDAVGTGVLPQIRHALTHSVKEVNETFAEQKRQYEDQLQELNERMQVLRQDLVAAREEMKRDALTGAYNRGAFDASIKQSLNMQFILNQTATLVLIDLDNFKEINDTFGHAAGDEVLRNVGECLTRSFIRKNDFVSRYGGDEFAVILNDTTASNSKNLIERFLQQVREIEIADSPSDHAVTCSIGYTELEDSDCVKSAVTRADSALYKAKHAGRNQAVCATPTEVDNNRENSRRSLKEP